jgi:putative tryptophan/tyrosine transport system substrate-binding protein
MVLKDNTVVSGLDVLVKLCNQFQIPLMASDLDSPDKGAAFGFGVYEVEFGTEAAKKALQILNEGESPGQIPVTPVSNFDLRINQEAAQKQGIDPTLIPSRKGEK